MRVIRLLLYGLSLSTMAGCASILSAIPSMLGASEAGLVGAAGAAQNFEYQKLIEVLPRYDGLEHH
ncbi:MAG: hypothetical protein QF781_10765, partial [Phycisphaerales bacterium]|nr:hypothetical protein [Phycisphaerales bacterium]